MVILADDTARSALLAMQGLQTLPTLDELDCRVHEVFRLLPAPLNGGLANIAFAINPACCDISRGGVLAGHLRLQRFRREDLVGGWIARHNLRQHCAQMRR